MSDVIYYLYMTWPLWAFVSILLVATIIEETLKAAKCLDKIRKL